MRVLPALTLAGALLAAAMPAAAQITKAPVQSTKRAIKVETVARGLGAPVGARVPARRAPARHRAAGRLRLVTKDGKLSAPLQGVPTVFAAGRAACSTSRSARLCVERAWSTCPTPSRRAAAPTARRGARAGSAGRQRPPRRRAGDLPTAARRQREPLRLALVFVPDGTLFVTLGERYTAARGGAEPSQRLGKMVRMIPTAPIPADNPRRPAGRPRSGPSAIATCRARRSAPTAAALDRRARRARRRRAQSSRKRARTTAGRSSPTASTTPAAKIGEGTEKPGMETAGLLLGPVDRAVAGCLLHRRPVSRWKGNLFVGALAGQAIERLVLDGDNVVAAEKPARRTWASASATSARGPTARCGCSPTRPRARFCGSPAD